MLPIVAIVGRPNVGKSSLYNRLLGRRVAIVSAIEGTTRDRLSGEFEVGNKRCILMDTGGYMPTGKDDPIGMGVFSQVEKALAEASVILFVTDARVGIRSEDIAFAKAVLRLKKKTLLVVNKAETKLSEIEVPAFWKLGMGEPLAVSASRAMGITALLNQIEAFLPGDQAEAGPAGAPAIRIAVVGRPNAGKSTFVNRLLGEERLIATEVPGTTRDCVNIDFQWEGRRFVLSDTAGLRRKSRVKAGLDEYSTARAIDAIRSADICLLMLDIERRIDDQDLKILSLIQDVGKGAIMVLNKWDLMKADQKLFASMERSIRARVPEFDWVPIVAVSALTGKRVHSLMQTAFEVYQNLRMVLGREKVMEFFKEAVARNPHPSGNKGLVALDRCCQVGINPPTLAVEARNPLLIEHGYMKYLKNRAYQEFGLKGVPLKFYFTERLKLKTDEELRRLVP